MSLTEKKIAPRTRKQLRETILGVNPALPEATVNVLIDAIEDSFTVKRKPEADMRPEQPRVEMYQIWRNRNSRRVVRVRYTSGPRSNDVFWECIDGSRGPKKGSAWVQTFYNSYDYVAADLGEYEHGR